MFDYGFHQLRPKVQIRKFKSFVICTAYRTDDVPLSCFENDLLFSLNSAMSLNIPVFILADVNCNMLWRDAKEAKVLHDFCDSFNLTQVINKPKKLLSSSSPLLTLLLLKKQTWQRKHKLFHTQSVTMNWLYLQLYNSRNLVSNLYTLPQGASRITSKTLSSRTFPMFPGSF